MSGIQIGKNCFASLKEGTKRVVLLTIDPSTNLGPSGSGKTDMIAQVSGPLGGTKATLGANLFVKSGEKPVISKVERTELGKNLAWSMDGTHLFVEIDFSNAENETVPSTSGKTILLASSKGNARLGATKLTLGLNAYVKVGETFNAAALEKFLGADGSTTVGPFDYTKTAEHYVFSCVVGSGKGELTTKGYAPFDGVNKLQLSVNRVLPALTSTDGFVALPGAANIEIRIDGSTSRLDVRVKAGVDLGPSSSGKTNLMASSKMAKEFNGVKIALNALIPGTARLTPEGVLEKVTEFLEKRNFDLHGVTEKELRVYVADNVLPKQDVTDGTFKELVRAQLKVACERAGDKVQAAIAPSSSQVAKHGRDEEEEPDAAATASPAAKAKAKAKAKAAKPDAEVEGEA